MKYIITVIFGLLLFNVNAQQTIVYSNIKVGETLPDVEFNNVDNFSKSNVKLSELNQKLLIIDFWATWCGPCIAKIPRMDSIMKAVPNEMLFLSVSNESKEKVKTFLSKKEKDMGTKLVIPSITEDTTLSKLFPHYFVPHYVWIKLPERKVIAITKGDEIRFDRIKAVLKDAGNAQLLPIKIDKILDYDVSEPLLPYLAQNDSIRANGLKQYSFITNYVPNLTGAMYTTDINGDTTETVRFVMKNVSIKAMAARAFGEGFDFFQDSSIAIEVKEPEKVYTDLSGKPYKEWQKENSYCYEIKTDKRNKPNINNMMRNDIIGYFPQYDFNVERRPKDSWVLISTGDNSTLKSKGGKRWGSTSGSTYTMTNQPSLKGFLTYLRYYYFMYSPILFADRTNIDFNIDMTINPKNYNNIEEVNLELAKYNLKFVRRIEPVDILVISDKKK